eukprot:Gregarina_sp_Poly_1__277@NODE_1068_length_5192_cov_185_777756_g194_i1_p3_GENE_NODE_1068_length_5192_cov_185_777756_g194_i1NODE_1068_length_5192_cov_185_777756_g194_i1_p3_ORF_typecomplete_len395_score54_90TPT/PF03151_16/4_7e57UAA/PF08449_11/2_6e23Nuc_sug_transp/PF04142_15/2_9e05Nuc_sug_transp/PF04142_15/0_00052EamA/PF00892_20/2_5e06EamA/PF00892_20/0_029SLC35F/PF06027_12/2_9e03SLC35F/PF06027_12/2_9e06SLC35F/PF06027_12/0_24CRTlike/PF08627_10/7_7e06CRTlike/PF08627_10/9_7PUNUT/PF16913_5/0_1_NODE_1068
MDPALTDTVSSKIESEPAEEVTDIELPIYQEERDADKDAPPVNREPRPRSIGMSFARILLKLWFLKTRLFNWHNILTGKEAKANIYLLIWFTLNVVITLCSKAMFSSFKFPYPMMLTAVHCAVTGIGSQIASYSKCYPTSRISIRQVFGLLFFSFIFTINIWLSNYGLLVVSVPVHQVSRTTIPLFTMILSLLVYRESYPWRMVPSVLLVIAGVAATVWGDLETTLYGGLIVAAGCAFSSLKGLMSQKAQIGAQGLETFDLLRVVCPLAVVELLVLGSLNGEVLTLLREHEFSKPMGLNLVLQGVLAFSLNFVSFKCAALKNPLTMNIAGNVKQVITPLLSVWFLGGSLTTTLLIGLFITFAGAVWYGDETRRRKAAMAAAKAETEILDQQKSV